MWELVKKYWDLLSGLIVGLALSIMAHSDSETVHWIYSVILMLLACVGLFRLIRQTIEGGLKAKKGREHTPIDNMVDNLIVVKAIGLAQEPTKEGEKYGKKIIVLWEATKPIMKKLIEIFDKYKGYILTVLLGILTMVENYGGYINQLCGGALTINGVKVLPIVTLVCTMVVGILSNGYTKEQMETIKATLKRSTIDELVNADIKKSLKENTAKYAQYAKIHATKETELVGLNNELQSLNNTYNAKVKMFNMTPQLASKDDVQFAANAVFECEQKIANKKAEIVDVNNTMEALKTNINALKSQL